jgi:hypothetical protein
MTDEFLQKIIDRNFSDLKGATANASIPLPAALINELVRDALKGNKNIASILVSVYPANQLTARVKTTLLPWTLDLKLKLDTSVDFASYASPKIRAWLENNRLLGSLGALFNALPEGIKLYGNQLVFDLGAFLRTPEQRKYLELIKSVRIQTEEGRVILDVQAAID